MSSQTFKVWCSQCHAWTNNLLFPMSLFDTDSSHQPKKNKQTSMMQGSSNRNISFTSNATLRPTPREQSSIRCACCLGECNDAIQSCKGSYWTTIKGKRDKGSLLSTYWASFKGSTVKHQKTIGLLSKTWGKQVDVFLQLSRADLQRLCYCWAYKSENSWNSQCSQIGKRNIEEIGVTNSITCSSSWKLFVKTVWSDEKNWRKLYQGMFKSWKSC